MPIISFFSYYQMGLDNPLEPPEPPIDPPEEPTLGSVTNVVYGNSNAYFGTTYFQWTDPDESNWGHTDLVRKSGSSAPQSASDGTLLLSSTVKNQYASSYYRDTTVSQGQTYTYRFFIYDTDGNCANSSDGYTIVIPTQDSPTTITIDSTPFQNGSLTYTGSSQSPSWNNYSSSALSVSGTTSGTNAGNYTATFTPKSGYKWWDGTTTGKNVTWSIEKLTPTLTISGSLEETLYGESGSSSTRTIFYNGDGVLTTSLSNSEILRIDISGNTLTLSNIWNAFGEVTVTVSATSTNNCYAPTSVIIHIVVLPPLGATLNVCSWQGINAVAIRGLGSSYWDIGDVKMIQLSGTIGITSYARNMYVYIIDFDRDNSNNITFGTFKSNASGSTDLCLTDTYYGYNYNAPEIVTYNMNRSSDVNIGGWMRCQIRSDVLGSNKNYGTQHAPSNTATSPKSNTFMSALPSDLRNVLKPITTYTSYTDGENVTPTIVETTDYLPLLSELEVFGYITYSNPDEANYQSQYAYYANGNSRIKNSDKDNLSVEWWLRSPASNTTTSFCAVAEDGRPISNNSGLSIGLAPIFRV